jgi:hypothetical protein
MLTPHAISAFASEPPPPRVPEPEDRPTPRQELIAAQLLGRGEPLPVAARMAGLRPEQLERLCAEPGFRDLREHCDATLARPAEERRARLEGLFHVALEQALAEGRVGAIAADMRLLGLVAPRGPGHGGRGSDGNEAGEEPLPSGERWGLVPHDEHGWATPDGRPAMPGRELDIIDTEGGPVRLLETFEFVAYGNDVVDSYDRMTPEEAHALNRLAYPGGGLQWDPVTRTLWHWQGCDNPEAFRPPGQRAAETAAARQAGSTSAALPKPKPEAPAPRPPTERQLLKARLDRLLATGMATSPEDVDLAEAVCAELWPNWPRYEGTIDPWHVRDVLAQTRLKPGDLARLGGEACSRPHVPHSRRRRHPARPRSPPS